MRINTLRLRNFRGFEEETFQLNSRFTVFIGDNAKGKTSILEALSIAAGSFFLGIDKVSSKGIQEDDVRVVTIDGQPKPQKPVIIQAFWEFTALDRSIWDLNPQQEKMVWVRELLHKNTTHQSAFHIRDFAKGLLEKSRSSSGVVFPVIAYYGTGRLWALHEKLKYQKQEEGVVMAYTNALSSKASPKEFLEWYKTQEDSVRKFEDVLEMAHLTAFKEVITTLIPEKRWEDIAFDNKANDLVGIFTSGEGRREKLKFSQLSDGFRNVIALAADIAYRCIQLNPHLGAEVVRATPGIVMIDELDLHLHPNWQRHIVNDLKNAFPSIQFVVTTHSPFIVQSLKAEELIILDDDIKKDGDPFKKSLEDVVANEMGVEDVPRSKEFLEMQEVAEEYYQLISQGKKSVTDLRTQQLRGRLNELESKFADDPAFVAALKIERNANGL
jgi:predicted ATP-binding protein involved in virulence